jgi:hypothetical protein
MTSNVLRRRRAFQFLRIWARNKIEHCHRRCALNEYCRDIGGSDREFAVKGPDKCAKNIPLARILDDRRHRITHLRYMLMGRLEKKYLNCVFCWRRAKTDKLRGAK